jgi:hypothetical protein
MTIKWHIGKEPDDDNWCCPRCGGTEQWFDRTVTCDRDGNEIEGMVDRCVQCGVSTDKWVKRGQA